MKKIISNPMSIVFLLFASVLIGSNICCTGRASNQEQQSTTMNASTVNSGVVQSITTGTFDESIKSGIVLVDFWATWCRPCKMQSPILEEVSTEMAGKASIFKIDIDQNSTIADRFNVQSIPTMIIFKDGEAVSKFVGLTEKSDIITALEKYTNSK